MTIHKGSMLFGGLVCVLTASCASRALAAQDKPTVDEMLSCFEQAYSSTDSGGPGDHDIRCGGTLKLGVTAVVFDPQEHPELFEAAMDGLERFAVEHPDHRVRFGAALAMITPSTVASREGPRPVMERVVRVYESSEDPAVRAMLIETAPLQVQLDLATQFLVQVAVGTRADPDQLFPDEVIALNSIARLENGAGVLQQLSVSGAVSSEAGKEQLATLRNNDFRSLDIHP